MTNNNKQRLPHHEQETKAGEQNLLWRQMVAQRIEDENKNRG